MSDTPRTDAAILPDGEYKGPLVWAETARQLKRMLAEAREQRCQTINDYETAVLREHRMQEQRDTLVEALELMWPFIEEDDHPNCNTPAFSAAIAKYKAALAAVKGGEAMSDTPRTDAAVMPIDRLDTIASRPCNVVHEDVCQQLERELADACKQRDKPAEVLKKLERTAGQSTLWDDPVRHEARRALAAVKGGSDD